MWYQYKAISFIHHVQLSQKLKNICGTAVYETAIQQMTLIETSTGPIMAFNNEPEPIP